jgi:hypothetical protein
MYPYQPRTLLFSEAGEMRPASGGIEQGREASVAPETAADHNADPEVHRSRYLGITVNSMLILPRSLLS